ncbi:hypothetical protein JKP88DRAFT_181745, partial [Tribonema minus]
LRADYSLSCDTSTHKAYCVYAGVMILVYPIGIPALYMALLWRQRAAIAAVHARRDSRESSAAPPDCNADNMVVPLDREVDAITFLWQPYKGKTYYWEVVECGRRLLLTGILTFILPGEIGQSAYACVFAYFMLLVYLSSQPHMERTDRYLYTLGQTIIFLTMFIALLGQSIYRGLREQNGNVVGVLMILLNLVRCYAFAAKQ